MAPQRKLNFNKVVIVIKEITDEQMNILIKNGTIKNTRKGFVNQKGFTVGFYRTRNKRYIEDKYADMAKSLS